MADEQKWLKQIKAHDSPLAKDKLIRKYYTEIYSYVVRQVFDKDIAMDLSQEIFINMIRGLQTFNEKKSSFRTWLYHIASNRLIDYYRTQKNAKINLSLDTEQLDIPDTKDFETAFENAELTRYIMKRISEQDCTTYEIFMLKFFRDYTFSEIQESLQIPESTIKSKYYTMVNKLREEFKHEVY